MSNNKPIHERRLGRIKAAIWEDEGENGVRYNVAITRLSSQSTGCVIGPSQSGSARDSSGNNRAQTLLHTQSSARCTRHARTELRSAA